MTEQRNVLGGPLDLCSTDPLTGYLRDGCCTTGPENPLRHTICAIMTSAFIEFQASVGNDLTTIRPDLRFPGLVPGDRWCVIAAKWFEAYQAGNACPVVLSATNEATLEIVPLSALLEHAVDRPAA
ncbi:DUF2237 family protein [Kaistia adipata]|uniref:DUF2237 family protein n=1 Tax=Kaistia adipata TaxID=166954 RepID=UPI0004172B04|nr:DUF2237 domain-containing protein [Kaistia adipata]